MILLRKMTHLLDREFIPKTEQLDLNVWSSNVIPTNLTTLLLSLYFLSL